jgi:hypothetical protein
VIGFYAAGAANSGSAPLPVNRFVGANYATTSSGSSMTLAVPAGATAGDTLIMCAVVRSDRSATAPIGFTTQYTDSFGSGTQGTRVYVWSKAYASETSITATHSANAAYGAALMCVRGSILQSQAATMAASGVQASITVSGPATLVSFGGYQPRDTTGGVVPVGSNAGWVTDGQTAYITSSTLINYLGYVYHRTTAGGTSTVEPGISPGSVANRAGFSWVAEIG